MSLGSDSLWLRPLPPAARGLVKLEIKIHELVWGTVLGVWIISLVLGLLLAWGRAAPPELIFWAMPTLFGAILFAGRLSGSDRRQGTEEFSLALPVSRTLKYWVHVSLTILAWLSLSLGGWFFLNLPTYFRELREDGDRYALNLNQQALILALCFVVLCLTFLAFGTWRRAGHFETLAKQWPWAFFVFAFAGVTPVSWGSGWPLLFNVPIVLAGCALLWVGHRLSFEMLLQPPLEKTRPVGYRILGPLFSRPALRRTLWYGELRSLDGSWGILGLTFVIPSVMLGVLGDGIPRAYLPWVFLGVALLCFSGLATWVAGTRTDFDVEEFLGALPPLRKKRFRVRFFLGLGIAITFFSLVVAVLRSGAVPWLVARLPDLLRRTPLGTESLPPLFNAETAVLLVPLVLYAYTASYFFSQRHRELGKDYSENVAGNASIVGPALTVIFARYLGARIDVLWPLHTALVLVAVALMVWFYLRAERRAQSVDLPESRQKCGPLFWQLSAMLGGMCTMMFGFSYLLAVGEADRLGRFHAAGSLEPEQFLERTHVSGALGPWQSFLRRARAECYALAEDLEDCKTRESRRLVRNSGQGRAEINRREDAYRASPEVPWRFVRYVEEFGSDTVSIEEFVERLRVAESDPELEVADRGWFARSGRTLEDFKARQNQIRERLGPVYGGLAEAGP
ncbi:MAG: hypothetical protein AAGK22_04485 [Acidobacteriota bacterium]